MDVELKDVVALGKIVGNRNLVREEEILARGVGNIRGGAEGLPFDDFTGGRVADFERGQRERSVTARRGERVIVGKVRVQKHGLAGFQTLVIEGRDVAKGADFAADGEGSDGEGTGWLTARFDFSGGGCGLKGGRVGDRARVSSGKFAGVAESTSSHTGLVCRPMGELSGDRRGFWSFGRGTRGSWYG